MVTVGRPDEHHRVCVGIELVRITLVHGGNGVDPKDEGVAWGNTVESGTEVQVTVFRRCDGAEEHRDGSILSSITARGWVGSAVLPNTGQVCRGGRAMLVVNLAVDEEDQASTIEEDDVETESRHANARCSSGIPHMEDAELEEN